MNTATSVRGASLPHARPDVFYVDPIRAAARVKGKIWSPSVWGVWTHYHNKQTTPCYEDHNHCAEGHDPMTLRWKGYLLGWNYQENRPTYFQLTAQCVRGIFNAVPDRETLRGLVFLFKRTAKHNGRLLVEWCEYESGDVTQGGPDTDPRASLYNLWHLPDPGWKWSLSPIVRLADVPEVA